MTQQEAEIKVLINDKGAEKKLEKLEAKAKQLRIAFSEAFKNGDTKGVAKAEAALKKVNHEMDIHRLNVEKIRAAMMRLDKATPHELRKGLRLLNEEINSGRVKRGTKEWDAYVKKIREVKEELRKVKAEMAPDTKVSFFDKLKNGVNGWAATAAAGAAAFAGVVMSGKSAVKAYADLEQEQANVRKFTGMTAEEVKKLNEEMAKIDTRTSQEDLNKLAQEAGRLGKTSQEDVLGFVRAADQINVALDDLGEGATLTLSKLTSIFGDEARYGTEQSLLKVGSVVNELSQNCSASAPYLAEFASRVGGIGAQAKMTVSQIMAFGAVLDTQNLNVEASATVMGQLITKIYQEPAKIAQAAGLDVQKFANIVKTDMNGALMMLFEQLKGLGGMESLAPVFDEMGTDGARAIPVLTALTGHLDELKQQQVAASQAFADGTSVTKEFNVQNETVQAQLDKAKKGFQQMAVTLGEQLLPVMRYCISGTSLLMRVLSALFTFVSEHKKSLIVLATSFVAFSVAVNLATIKAKAHAAVMLLVRTATAAMVAGQYLASAALALVTGNLSRARRAWMLFSMALKSDGIAALVSAIAALIAIIITFVTDSIIATNEMKKLRAEQEAWKKSLTDIDAISANYCSKEITRLKGLYSTAINYARSYDERRKAAERLKKLYPAYFKNLSTEEIMAGNAANAYLKLKGAILEAARARAAAQKIEENEKELLTLQEEEEKLRDQTLTNREQLKGARGRYVNAKNKNAGSTFNMLNNQNVVADASVESSYRQMDEANKRFVESNRAWKDNRRKQAALNESITFLMNKFPNAVNKAAQADNVNIPATYSGGGAAGGTGSGGSGSGGGTVETEAEKANKALKKALDEQRELYAQADAKNLARYVTGQQDYQDYLDQKEKLDKENVDAVLKIHEDHNKIDAQGYAQALKEKADMKKKQEDEERKKDIKYSLGVAEGKHTENVDKATQAFFDPNSTEFQNKKILNQKLFEEDIRYLQEKRAIYIDDAEKRAEIDAEIEERIKQDKLDKQKETAEAMMEFEREYRSASGSIREKNELAIVEELHAQGLITEEEYQKAVRVIKDKYRKEDIDKSRKVQSEYADMVLNLYNSFSKFFSELGKEGGDFWNNLSDAATAAYAVIGAVMSQYSAYVTAERDAELAKVEKRYEKEIAAAGKNTKKREKLEKQKEAETARIKKKYNDRAMKIELAQALAQTAQAAIAAYASAAAIPGTGWLLAATAAAMATAAGMAQVAVIKKQHEAEAAGYYEGGFTARDGNNRREVGVVHANEFVANHRAVANPALSPVLRLIDLAQRNNTVGSLTAEDVSNALGQGSGVSARGVAARSASYDSAITSGLAVIANSNASAREALNRLSDKLDEGIEAKVILDGEDGFHSRYKHYQKLINNPKR